MNFAPHLTYGRLVGAGVSSAHARSLYPRFRSYAIGFKTRL
jgi:hypothetical protein